MFPPRVRRPGGRFRRGRSLAALTAALLAVPLITGALAPDRGSVHPRPVPEVTPFLGVDRGVEPGSYTTMLVTGDRVMLDVDVDGRLTVDVIPSDRDRADVGFESIESGQDFYVIPTDTAPLVPDRLDLELFNVTKLAEYGYTDDIPVIITYDRAPAARLAVTGAEVAAALPSIDGVAATVTSGGAWWRSVLPAAGPTTMTALAGVEKVWLDEQAKVTLDESVPLVGAPAAWQAGYDGSGVTIAVLDTGIDADHPDLAGKVIDARNFTADPDTGDDNGHGTHVAATAAGTGAGSDGLRSGVAPGASLVNAKVCNQSGTCPTSAIIAGMEWVAADLGVDVANMSLGTLTASDGTDLISQAVNQLTEQFGTLFVIAAGNAGPAATTVGSPGAASAALTVGSVSKARQLASSSSRGPRLHDFAIKPDVTAAGVDIVAARAAGTSLGTPVDDLYTRASGTSMATPHVAGAAAILLQQNPELAAGEVKAALATTGAPRVGLDVYEQGGGLIDIEAAIDAPVLATPAPLDLGYFPYPHDNAEPNTSPVTYTNRTDADLTLTLSAEVTDENGAPPSEGMVSLDTDIVTIPARGTATVDVTVDVNRGAFGLYGGYLVARHAGEVVARTPVGFFKEAERYELLVRAIDTEGKPATGGLTVMNVADQNVFFQLTVNYDAAGVARLRVPPGTYAVYGFADTLPEGETLPTVRTAVAEPELQVTDDVEVTFDARTAIPINVETPAHDVVLDEGRRQQLSLTRLPAVGLGATRSLNVFTVPFLAVPTDEAEIGLFEFNMSFRLTEPGDPGGSSVLYHVVIPEVGSIPETLDYTVRPEDLGVSHQEFYNHLPGHQGLGELRHWWRPWQTSSLAINEPVTLPIARTEYLAPADIVSWTRSLLFAPPGVSSAAARMNAPRLEYQPGEQETRTWMKQPVKPGLIEGSPWHPTFSQFREGDALDLSIAEFSDSQLGHWGLFSAATDQAAFRLYTDGELIAEGVRPRGVFALPPVPSRVRIETDVSRDQAWWLYSTRTSTAWEFESERPPPFEARIVAPPVIDLDPAYVPGSPVLDEPVEKPVVFAGLGYPEDFADIDANGAVVFMRRGVLTFNQKAENAANAGAAAAVIFNNVPGAPYTPITKAVIPTLGLPLDQGEAVVDLLDTGDVTIAMSAGSRVSVPLLLVDYDVELDLLNTAPHRHDRGGPYTVDMTVRHQPGLGGLPAPSRPAIDGARLWISYDDGSTWRRRPVHDLGDGHFRAILDSRDPEETNGFVALRVEAWDTDGNRIEQEIIRAWALPPRDDEPAARGVRATTEASASGHPPVQSS